MKSGHGCLRRKRRWAESGVSTAATLSLRAFADTPRYRSNENLASSAVTGSPLWNLTPLRSTNSYTRPSGETVHDSARLGAIALPGIGFTSASCSAYRIMNGETTPGVSAGSNSVGASEKCSAHVIWPSGAASTAAGAIKTSRSTATITHRLKGFAMVPSFAYEDGAG